MCTAIIHKTHHIIIGHGFTIGSLIFYLWICPDSHLPQAYHLTPRRSSWLVMVLPHLSQLLWFV